MQSKKKKKLKRKIPDGLINYRNQQDENNNNIKLFISPKLTARYTTIERHLKRKVPFLSIKQSMRKCRAFIADLQPVQLLYPTVSNGLITDRLSCGKYNVSLWIFREFLIGFQQRSYSMNFFGIYERFYFCLFDFFQNNTTISIQNLL